MSALASWWRYDVLLWWHGYPGHLAGEQEIRAILWGGLCMLGLVAAVEAWDRITAARQPRRRRDD